MCFMSTVTIPEDLRCVYDCVSMLMNNFDYNFQPETLAAVYLGDFNDG